MILGIAIGFLISGAIYLLFFTYDDTGHHAEYYTDQIEKLEQDNIKMQEHFKKKYASQALRLQANNDALNAFQKNTFETMREWNNESEKGDNSPEQNTTGYTK